MLRLCTGRGRKAIETPPVWGGFAQSVDTQEDALVSQLLSVFLNVRFHFATC